MFVLCKILLMAIFLVPFPTIGLLIAHLENAAHDDLELRNDYNLHFPFSRLKFTSYFPFFNLPRLWTAFDNDFPSFSIF